MFRGARSLSGRKKGELETWGREGRQGHSGACAAGAGAVALAEEGRKQRKGLGPGGVPKG